MELTTGALLRRITETALSVSAHKLATIILDVPPKQAHERTGRKP